MTLFYLVKRNTLLYFKDKTAVLFSLLSVLIVLLLMVVFLGDMNKVNLLEVMESIKGSPATLTDEYNAQRIIWMWTIAGMLAVNSFTVPLTVVGIYVEDKQYHKLESFFCAPISRIKLLCGYLLSAVFVGMIMCCITLFLSALYVMTNGAPFLTIFEIIKILGLLFICVSVSSCIIILIAQFIHTSNAWGSLSTLAGTLIGFLGGIYLPMSMLPDAVQTILKSFPFLHEASLLRSVFCQNSLQVMFQGAPDSITKMYQEMMGIQVHVFGNQMNMTLQVLCLLGCAIITLAFAVYMLQKHTSFDR